MASKLIDIHGKVKYIHAVALNKYNRWSITLYPTDESMKLLRELKSEGLKNEFQRDDDGDYMSFHRDPEKLVRGKTRAFAAPKVIDKDGNLMDGYRVGWGSDVTCRLEYYKNGPKSPYKFAAVRWDSLRVDNLVPFEAERDLPPTEAAEVKSLKEAEEPKPW